MVAPDPIAETKDVKAPAAADAKKEWKREKQRIITPNGSKPIQVFYMQEAKTDAAMEGSDAVSGAYEYEHPDHDITIRKYKQNPYMLVLKGGKLMQKVNCGIGACDAVVIGYFAALDAI